MDVREALEDASAEWGHPLIKELAPIIERALDSVLDWIVESYGITASETPKEIRDRWHSVFVATMVKDA